MLDVLVCLLGIIGGFAFSQMVSGKYEGDKVRRSIRFSYKKYTIHIHHWFIAFILLVVFYLLHKTYPIIVGLLVGLMLQGLCYRDRFLFIYRTTNFNKIYSKWKK